MRIALAQMKNQGSVKANLNQSIEWMREAAEHGADLILFPEVQLTEFFPQYQGQDVRRYRLGLESPEVPGVPEGQQRVEHLGIAQRLSGGERKGV